MYWIVCLKHSRELGRSPVFSWDERAKHRARKQAKLLGSNTVRIVDDQANILWEEHATTGPLATASRVFHKQGE